MKTSMFCPEVENLEDSRPSSVRPNLGRGRGLAITFQNKFLANAKSEMKDEPSRDINMNEKKRRIKEARAKVDCMSESSENVRSEDEIIICSRNEQDDDYDIEKTYSVIQCWPSVDDKIWSCWDKSGKERNKDDDDDFLLDYAPFGASYSKASMTTSPKASMTTYPKASVTTYRKPKVTSLEISTPNEWPAVSIGMERPISNVPKVCLYETVPYSLSLPIKCLPRKYMNKLNSSRNNGELSYRFDTGYDPNLSKKKLNNEDKYSEFHKKVRTPYTRKINYWTAKEKDDKALSKEGEVKDPVSALYIWCSRNKAIPTFTFTSEIEYGGKVLLGMIFICKITVYESNTVGKGSNKKEAKRVASEKMLEIINSGFAEDKPNKDGDEKKKAESNEEKKLGEEETSESDEEGESDCEYDSDEVKEEKLEKEKSDEKKKSDLDGKEKTEADEVDEKGKAEADEKEKIYSDKKKTTDFVENEKDVKENTGLYEKCKTDLEEKKKTESDEEEKVEIVEEKGTDLNEDETNTEKAKEAKPTKIRSDKKKKYESGKTEKTDSYKKEEAVFDEKKPDSNRVELSEMEYKKAVSPINVLQEICVMEKWTFPDYKIEPFGSIFKCQIHLFVKGESVEESGFGHTKKEAKTKAASNALKILEESNVLTVFR